VKLAIVRQKYTPFGGAERFVARALDALRARGVDVSIIARQWQGEAGGGHPLSIRSLSDVPGAMPVSPAACGA
jgi:hypothetical protein